MSVSEYLRTQADTCLRIARAGFDLTTAERLRHMAADLRAKADEIDEIHEAAAHEAASANGGFAPHLASPRIS